jgi:hypothetical protein
MGNRNVPRQSVVSAGVVEALIGEQGNDNGVVSTLIDEQIKEEQKQQRKNPLRPSEVRRKKRMLTITFSTPVIPARVRALAKGWGMFTAAGYPNHSAVVEYLLLPQIEGAERGEVDPPPANQNEIVEGEQWF